MLRRRRRKNRKMMERKENDRKPIIKLRNKVRGGNSSTAGKREVFGGRGGGNVEKGR